MKGRRRPVYTEKQKLSTWEWGCRILLLIWKNGPAQPVRPVFSYPGCILCPHAVEFIGINFAPEVGRDQRKHDKNPLGGSGFSRWFNRRRGGGIYLPVQCHAAVIKSVFSPKDTVMISHFSRQELVVVVVVVVVEWFRCDISLL